MRLYKCSVIQTFGSICHHQLSTVNCLSSVAPNSEVRRPVRKNKNNLRKQRRSFPLFIDYHARYPKFISYDNEINFPNASKHSFLLSSLKLII
jgi:hypothetical protein